MKMASTLIDLAHFFFLLAKNKFARAARFFVYPLTLFCTTTTMFVRLRVRSIGKSGFRFKSKSGFPNRTHPKTSNFLVTHCFYGGIVECAYPCNILFPVFMFAFIFHCRSFSPCWPLAFLIFSPPL